LTLKAHQVLGQCWIAKGCELHCIVYTSLHSVLHVHTYKVPMLQRGHSSGLNWHFWENMLSNQIKEPASGMLRFLEISFSNYWPCLCHQ
jgi:hypothetical protein